ncbi:MAG: hypothetical protein U0441_11860 [Polyangiaceae bacterium]
MRNSTRWFGGSLIVASSLFVASSALADTCERDEEHPDSECREYETFFMPGGQAMMYKPQGVAMPYVGGGFHIDVVRWSHHNNDFGPGEGAVYMQGSLLKSPSSEHTLGIYEGGFNLSFEKNPKRRYLIPYFGMTAGGMFADDLPHSGFVQPLAGLHVYSAPSVIIEVQGGYMFPTDAVDQLNGFRAQASLRFHLW